MQKMKRFFALYHLDDDEQEELAFFVFALWAFVVLHFFGVIRF